MTPLKKAFDFIKTGGQSTQPVGAFGTNPNAVPDDNQSGTPYNAAPSAEQQQTMASTGPSPDEKTPEQKMKDKDDKAKEYSSTTLRQLAHDLHLQEILGNLNPKTSAWRDEMTAVMHQLGPSKSQNEARKELGKHGNKVIEALAELDALYQSGNPDTKHTPNSPFKPTSRASDW
jgi:hypothetical protein